mgnify:CR=1 FL=1
MVRVYNSPMSLLILREFDYLYDECVNQGWVPHENTEDAMRIVSPGNLAEVKIILRNNQIKMSVPIRCDGEPYATQYMTHLNDAEAAATFGEMHVVDWEC